MITPSTTRVDLTAGYVQGSLEARELLGRMMINSVGNTHLMALVTSPGLIHLNKIGSKQVNKQMYQVEVWSKKLFIYRKKLFSGIVVEAL